MHPGCATIFVRYQPSLLDRPRILVHRSNPNLLHVTASETYPVNTQGAPNVTNRSRRRSFLNRSPTRGSETTQSAARRYAVEAFKPSPSGMLRLTKRVGLSSFRDCFRCSFLRYC